MTIHLRNLVATADDLAARLWREAGRGGRDPRLRALAEDLATSTERLCRQAGGGPSDLPARSRWAYAWLRFLSVPARWDGHMDALLRWRAALQGGPGAAGSGEVHLLAMDALWRLRDRAREGRPPLLRLHQGFMAAPEGFCRDFAGAWARGRLAELHGLGRDLSLAPGFLEVSEVLRSLAPVPEPRSHVHDLEASFRRVNTAFFGGGMARPALRWGSAAATRTRGSYRFAEDLLTLSPHLDAPDVPEWVLDFVMYHELLHKALGLTPQGSRRHAHTSRFRALERAHPRFLEAEAFLRRLDRRVM